MISRPRLRALCPRHARRTLPTHSQRRQINHYISQSAYPLPPTIQVSYPKPPIPHTHTFTLAVKDNIATNSPLPTTCASPFLADYTSPIEATIVRQLRDLGLVVTAKTNLDEFGMGSHSVHAAHGAVAQERGGYSAGGSSGGSAVAVANGEVDIALGTDTGGSVRLPAAYCGVVGYKPSYGMLSRYGVVPYANSLDTVGLVARGVGRIRQVVVDKGLWRVGDGKDPTSLGEKARRRIAGRRENYDGGEVRLEGLRLGLPVEYNIEELERGVRDAWVTAAGRLEERGAKVVPVSLPTTRHALSAYYVIAPAEASSNLAKYDGVRYGRRAEGESDAAEGGVLYAASRGQGFGEEVKRRILLGSYTLSSEAMDNYFLKAQAVRRLVRRDFDRVFRLENPLQDEQETFNLSEMSEEIPMQNKLGPAEVDFLLCPTAPTLAPKLLDVMGGQGVLDAYTNDVFTVPASLAGLPAVSVPIPVEGEERMAGLQLIGQYWDDARLLGVAEAVSKVLGGPA
ncbi:amidase signature domain-containing protein [Podospora aff. communis PSN243]|uniref:Glutamyl-tRNA(Gln) amidotransferase subunit A, mitochondrial n=1 Tax=Podospora aff. communis PSN243 TaxID=3040156 RepID=A0AAV9GYE6_9PEZI|nr:amidase signature domain-containing protein [Podospora aff. communis PSN243]